MEVLCISKMIFYCYSFSCIDVVYFMNEYDNLLYKARKTSCFVEICCAALPTGLVGDGSLGKTVGTLFYKSQSNPHSSPHVPRQLCWG